MKFTVNKNKMIHIARIVHIIQFCVIKNHYILEKKKKKKKPNNVLSKTLTF